VNSIGSLAKDVQEAGVQNVTVKKVVFTGTTNGLRIKSWGRPSTGFVNGVIFQNVVMKNVENPIIIDQNYCPHNEKCPGQVYTHEHYYYVLLLLSTESHFHESYCFNIT
jgi:polygalacturonase